MSIILDFVDGRQPPDLYDAYLTPWFETWSDVLVESAPPEGVVLDIACGTGIVSRKLSQTQGVDHVDAIDVAHLMIEKAKAVTGSKIKVAFQVASADQLPFEDNRFNAAYCQQGLQFFPNKVAALQEAARVVRPGGALNFAIWTAASDGNPVFGAFEDLIASKLGDELVPFGPFSFGDANQIESVASDAGLKNIRIERVERLAPLPDPRTLMLFDLLFLGRPGPEGDMQPLFDPSDASKDDLIETLIAQFEEAVSRFHQPGGGLLAPSSAHILTAEAPS